jgi:NAD(P)-dependent dehydrogenase (short-subunit alcohol dehydrogenase family)
MARLREAVAAVNRGHDGVGRAIADAYEREGAQVVVGNPSAGDERRTAEDVVDAAVERFGRLDLLVLVTAADPPMARIAEMTDDQWIGSMEATLNHTFWGIRRALQHMIPRKQGRILVVSSFAAKLAVPGGAAGAATEHAVTGLVKSAAHEVGTLGIKVNALLCGVLEDADSNGRADETAAFLERSTIGRPNTVEEVAGAAVLLASPSLGSVTGCLFPVDGGTMPY